MKFNLDNYETVESRIARFWAKYPNGRIETSVYYYDENRVVFRAALYDDGQDPNPKATGYAEEVRDASPVNRTSHVENAETSAIGRALANFEFQSKTQPRPSREEMEKVQRMTEPQESAKQSSDADLVTKFRQACAKAGLDPQEVAKEAGTDLNNLTNDSMPKLRDAFKRMQQPKTVTMENLQSTVQQVFDTKGPEYRQIKNPDAPATGPQKGKLRALLNGAGKHGPAAHADMVAEIINKPVTSLDQLTKSEADRAIKVLDERASR